MVGLRAVLGLGLAMSVAACGETPYTPVTTFDAGLPSGPDVGFWGLDATSPTDAAPPDAGTPADTGTMDGTAPDAEALDGAPVDAATGPEAGIDDAGAGDAGPGQDAGDVLDGGVGRDAGDGGAPDGGAGADAALPDASPVDGGVLAVQPTFTEVALGAQATFEVTAPAAAAPVWSVDGVPGGDAVRGTVVPQIDPRRATYTAPSDAAGLPLSHSVEVTIAQATGAASVALAYPAPTLTAVSPNRVATGANVQVTLTGTGFASGSRVQVAGYPASAVLQGPTSLTVTLPSQASSSPGTRQITVLNPTPGGGQASLPIELVLTDVTVDPTLPATIEGLFDAATVSTLAARQPVITYPETGAVTPRNFPAPQVSFEHPGSNVCRVRMASATVQTDIYVSVPNAASPMENTSATHPAPMWTNIAASVLGASQSLTLTAACGSLVDVAGTPALAGGEVFESTPVTYVVSPDALGGRIVYFSGLIEGLWRIDLGLSVATGQPFAGPDPSFPLDTSPQCLGCHSFSANGQRMGYIADAVEWNVGMMSVSNGVPTVAVPAASGVVGDWTSVHPTDDVLLSIDLTGQITLVDSTNGQLISVVPTQAAGAFVTHPVWAPDGSMIAFVSGAAGPDGVADAAQGQIWTMPVTRVGTQYSFGPPNLVASPAVAGGSAYYPAFSPDGQWILFSQAATGSSYDNLQARVWLVSTDGTIGPVELSNANQPGPNLSNSWPRWAPQVIGSRYWIVFNSQRPYGPYNGTGPQQLWVATIDTSLMPLDPSSPAVWLPGQEPFTGNLTAEWTVAF